MNPVRSSLCERLKELGYAKNNKLRMYGEEFELLSDPLEMGDHQVVVEAVARKSGRPRKLSLPLSVVQMIRNEIRAA
jgi:hypothetical protein